MTDPILRTLVSYLLFSFSLSFYVQRISFLIRCSYLSPGSTTFLSPKENLGDPCVRIVFPPLHSSTAAAITAQNSRESDHQEWQSSLAPDILILPFVESH